MDTNIRVKNAVDRMHSTTTKGDLGRVLADEISKYSMYELQVIGGLLKKEVDKLPSPYRGKVRPYFEQQLFGMYHRLLILSHSNKFSLMQGQITDLKSFNLFVEMIPSGCFCDKEIYNLFNDPIRSLFYYLISGFAMFVIDEPGHPVGTPFPGGFVVEKKGVIYLCPIRDKEDEIPFSLCNFCPAKQMEGV